MKTDDIDDFRSLLTEALAYWNQSLSPFALDVWWQAMQGFDLQDVRRALGVHAMDAERGMFAPKPADIVRVLEGAGGDRAARAWSKVHYAIRCVGPYQTIAFDDPLIHAVITDMGGFSRLCDAQTEDMPFRAREFETRYRAYVTRRAIPAYPPTLVGDVEAHNRANNHLEHIPEPILVGDHQKALSVIRGGQEQIAQVKPMSAVMDALRLRAKEEDRAA